MQNDERPVDYRNIVWFIICHGAALAAIPLFTWRAGVIFAVSFTVIVATIGLGYHRFLAHRCFKTHRWIERLIGFVGVLAVQRGPAEWVAIHRMHHAGTDTEADPHSAARGYWHSHMGWLLVRPKRFYNERVLRAYARDILKDPFMAFIDKENVFFPLQIALFVALYYAFGLSEALYGTAVRLVVHYHLTFTVNAACHKFGYRNYETSERSTNLPWLAFLTFGEAWHNNHHAEPESALNNRQWWEFDLGGQMILAAERLGLVWDVKRPTVECELQPQPAWQTRLKRSS